MFLEEGKFLLLRCAKIEQRKINKMSLFQRAQRSCAFNLASSISLSSIGALLWSSSSNRSGAQSLLFSAPRGEKDSRFDGGDHLIMCSRVAPPSSQRPHQPPAVVSPQGAARGQRGPLEPIDRPLSTGGPAGGWGTGRRRRRAGRGGRLTRPLDPPPRLSPA